MSRKIIFKFFIVFSFSLMVCGCWGADGNFKKTRNEVFEALIATDFDMEFEYSFSSIEIYLASKAASLFDRTFDLEILLEKISRIDLGVYKLENEDLLTYENFIPLEERMRKNGWTKLIKMCDHNERYFVYINIKNTDRIKDIFVLSVDSNQLVMVKLQGRFDKLIEQVIRRRGIKV